MRILHTSDWHLGRALFGRKRYEEFQAFLDWLVQTIADERIDALLVAGDVFDTNTPSNRAQALYYRLLCQVAASCCRHVVVIAGNHDSPSFLDAPHELLKALQVHVIGQARAHPEDEVVVLHDAQGQPELIVCAVPYLRERDIRSVEPGESLHDKERKLLEGIRSHYAAAAAAAQARRAATGRPVPIVGMGHLFTSGGQTLDGDGVRELYVGSLAHVDARLFPACFDYLALGHLHVPQTVAGNPAMRYSGAPIPMGFGEAAQRKSVCVIEWPDCSTATTESSAQATAPSQIRTVDVPVFHALARIQGDWAAIEQALQPWLERGTPAWLEVVYDGAEPLPDLRERLEAAVAHSAIDILRIRNRILIERTLAQLHDGETLDELDEHQVFARCLDAHGIDPSLRPALQQTYQQALLSLQQQDPLAE